MTGPIHPQAKSWLLGVLDIACSKRRWTTSKGQGTALAQRPSKSKLNHGHDSNVATGACLGCCRMRPMMKWSIDIGVFALSEPRFGAEATGISTYLNPKCSKNLPQLVLAFVLGKSSEIHLPHSEMQPPGEALVAFSWDNDLGILQGFGSGKSLQSKLLGVKTFSNTSVDGQFHGTKPRNPLVQNGRANFGMQKPMMADRKPSLSQETEGIIHFLSPHDGRVLGRRHWNL